MALGKPIQIRLNEDKQLILETQAATAGKHFATYLREKLESDLHIFQKIESVETQINAGFFELKNLLPGVEDLAQNQQENNAAILLEILLLLRANSGSNKLEMVHAELNRQQLSAWKPKEKKENK